MIGMAPSKPLQIRLSAELREAIEKHCAQHSLEMANFIRAAVCKELGKPQLLDTIPAEGRPRKKPPRKTQ